MKKTIKISEILEKIEETKRDEIIKTFDECLKSICCEDVLWKNFEVAISSEKMVRDMLEGLSPEYLMVVCDKVHETYNPNATVRIAVKISNIEKDKFFVVRPNKKLTMAIISVTEKEHDELRKKAKKNR